MSALAMPVTKIYTAEDLEQMPGEARYELIRGELCPMPPDNGAEHGSKTARLSARVIVHVDDNNLGECFAAETRFTIERNPDTSMGPDFAFVAKDRLPDQLPKGYLKLSPDIVLETRSPGDSKREVSLKVARWLQAGTKVVWVIDPETKTLTVHRAQVIPQILGENDTLTCEDLLPGFSFDLSRLFRK